MINFSKHTFFLDKLAISTSTLCAIHCLFLPVILTVFPALGATIFGQESFHKWLLLIVVPSSVVAFTLGCREHKSGLVALLGVIGLAVLIFAAFFGHDVLGHDGERIATLIGALIIAIAHIVNYKLCRNVKCEH